MPKTNEVQQIDGYVRRLLERAKEKYSLNIDLDNPTRDQRLEAALAMQKEEDGFFSMEIMVGRKIDGSDKMVDTFAMLRLAQSLSPSDPRIFYNGFHHQYYPEGQ